MRHWTTDEIPDQSGKVCLITGANSGIGFYAAKALAEAGSHVVMACRNQSKANEARERILRDFPTASLDLVSLDLADLSSIRACAEGLNKQLKRLDLLINNAGIMAIPRTETRDGFEMQLGTNHLGHYALTALLIDKLIETPKSRIVSVSSGAHKPGRINFADLHGKKRYRKWGAYCQSKLANLLFCYELGRYLKRRNASTISVACHPGYANTNLQMVGPQQEKSWFALKVMTLGNRIVAQPAHAGAWPTLYAATAPVKSGDYIGPSGLFEMTGPPVIVKSSRRSHNEADGEKLWAISEEETGVLFPAATE
jgi:NAD(P)-dependent dehydrogenase (short-subunit alcohol dehydrogenase family)